MGKKETDEDESADVLLSWVTRALEAIYRNAVCGAASTRT